MSRFRLTAPHNFVPEMDSDSASGHISLMTLLRYLLGYRSAILDVAANPSSVWLGFIFVLSAGFAREYDRVDLFREPWHLLLPFAASLATSVILYFLVDQLAVRRSAKLRSFLQEYWFFLGLYWITAPLAWFYAIPVERLLAPASAVEANLGLLALVSVWRVLLIIRVIVVAYHANPIAAALIVMLFADSLVIFLLVVLPRPVPIIDIMAGVGSSEGEVAVAILTMALTTIAVGTYPIWVLASVIAFWFRQPSWRPAIRNPASSSRIDPSVWVLAFFSIVGWGLLLPSTQREQQLRTRVEMAIDEGRFQDAVTIMSNHNPGDFPPLWKPMSHLAERDRFLRVTDLVELLADRPSDWVRRLFVKEFRRQLEVSHFWFSVLAQLNDIERIRVLDVLRQLPEKEEIIRGNDEYSGFKILLRTLAEKEGSEVGRTPNQFSQELRDKAQALLIDARPIKAKEK